MNHPALRIGILGAARIAANAIIKPARSTGLANIAAVAARSGVRASAFARKHGIPRAYEGYQALLDDPAVDAVYVALPNSLHCEWTLRALQARKHVLCEKPFASNAAEAERMADAANRCDRVLVEGMHYRCHPLATRIAEVLRSGELGDIEHVDAWACIPLPNLNGDIRYRYDLAGGAVMDVGCYALNAIRLILGDELSVSRARAKLAGANLDRWTQADLRFASGQSARLTCSLWSLDLLKLTVEVRGTRGRLQIVNPYAPHMFHTLKWFQPSRSRTEQVPASGTTYDYQLRAFVTATRGGPSLSATPMDAVANMRGIDAIYRAAGLPVRGTPAS
jgi:predicted dehydrogenase